jgi:hypothetical protein
MQNEVWIAEGMDFLVLKRRKIGGETGASKAAENQKGRIGAP